MSVKQKKTNRKVISVGFCRNLVFPKIIQNVSNYLNDKNNLGN